MDSWQQQQQDLLPWEQPERQHQSDGWATAGSSSSSRGGNSWSEGGGRGRSNNVSSNRYNSSNNRPGGRDPNVRLQQMDYMQEMGSGRYSDEDSRSERWQQQQGYSSTRNSSSRKQQGGWDDDVRLQQMDFMGEMGSGRYSDNDDELTTGFNQEAAGLGFGGRRGGPLDQAAAGWKPRGAGYISQKGLGGKGDRVRQRQMDYMQEMGSGRYNDGDSDIELWGGHGQRNAAAAPPKRDDRVRHRQIEYMEDMGSERYSSSSDDDGFEL